MRLDRGIQAGGISKVSGNLTKVPWFPKHFRHTNNHGCRKRIAQMHSELFPEPFRELPGRVSRDAVANVPSASDSIEVFKRSHFKSLETFPKLFSFKSTSGMTEILRSENTPSRGGSEGPPEPIGNSLL